MIILIPKHIFDFSETGTGTPCKIADGDCAEDIAVVVGDRKITVSNNDGAGVIDPIHGSVIVGGRCGQIVKGLIDLHHEAIFFLGMDVEQLKRLLAVFQQEQAGELRFVDPLILYNNGG